MAVDLVAEVEAEEEAGVEESDEVAVEIRGMPFADSRTPVCFQCDRIIEGKLYISETTKLTYYNSECFLIYKERGERD